MQKKNLPPLILLVDSDYDWIKQLSNYLTAKGFRILTALSSKQALGLVFSKKPNLVIIDLFMPEIDGQTLKDIISINPETMNIQVLFLDSKLSKEQYGDYQSIQDKDVLSKQIETNELVCKIINKIKLLTETST